MLLGAAAIVSCNKFDLNYDEARQAEEAKEAQEVKENAAKIFGEIDPKQDWNSINSGTVSVTANANLSNIVKVQILTESPILNTDAKVLAEATATNGQTVTLNYDAPNVYKQLFAACINNKGVYHIQVFDVNTEEGILVQQGYGLVIPDYLGYGITAHLPHPYLVMDLTARNVVDMYLAVRPWLEAVGRSPEDPEIILMGYSQGGANTMAVQHLIETEYDHETDPKHIAIHRVFAGGGPYDVKATYERFIITDTADYPVAVPLVVQGMIIGNNLSIQMSDMMQKWLCDKVDPWINSKKYCTHQLNGLIGTKITHEMLTQEAMDQTSVKVAELYKAMNANSIISYNWEPIAPVYLMHSMDDETVPFANATHAKNKWSTANITYNFGHYGAHGTTCVRFIGAVNNLLHKEEEERKQYE